MNRARHCYDCGEPLTAEEIAYDSHDCPERRARLAQVIDADARLRRRLLWLAALCVLLCALLAGAAWKMGLM